MKHPLLIPALLAVMGLAACDNEPTVVNVPAAEPGPPGPAGATGATGKTGTVGSPGMTGAEGAPGVEGAQGATGKTGGSTTVIVTPPAEPAPAN